MSIKIRTPNIQFDCECELDDYAYLDIPSDPHAGYAAEVVIGAHQDAKNMYEPPSLNFSFDTLMSFVDSVRNDDVNKTYDTLKEIFEEPFSYSWNSKHYDAIQRSEAQAEYCLRETVDLLRYGGDLVFVNPSRGTIHRIASQYVGRCKVRFTRDVSETYITEISPFLSDLGIPFSRKKWQVKDTEFYYLSFNGSLARKMKMKNYMGFEVNPSSLVNAGLCTKIISSTTSTELSYMRAGVLKSFCYGTNNRNVVPVDILHKAWRSMKTYKVAMGLLHDMYTSTNAYSSNPKISTKMQLTYGARFLVGEFTHKGGEIYDDKGNCVYTSSHYAHSCRRLSKRWIRGDADGVIMANASYMLSDYTATVSYLGPKTYCERTHGRSRRVKINPKRARSKRVFAYDSKGKVIPRYMFPYTLGEGIGFEYCTSSYENVVSVSVKYADHGLFDEIT